MMKMKNGMCLIAVTFVLQVLEMSSEEGSDEWNKGKF